MTQEDKDLFLKDLSARLPYVVKIKCNDDTEPYTLLSINWNKELVIIGFEIDRIYATSKQKLADIKPYLRSMSSMTEEEKVQLSEYACIGEDLNGEFIDEVQRKDCAAYIDWLNKKMFDYRGLIEKNLALDCTELHIYD